MLTRHAITRRADEDGIDATVAERDYVLSHIVAQLHLSKPEDGGRLVFKGGTALRLVHIGDYRYSADLDFTVIGGGESAAVTSMTEVLDAAREHAGFPTLELAGETNPAIAYIGPLEASGPRHLKMDISDSEIVESIEQRSIRELWSDLPEPVPFDVYPVDEIAAEKLRCVIQRVQCRDLNDLYRMTEDLNLGVSLAEVRPLFERKTMTKALDPGTFAERFEDRTARYRERWQTEMHEHLASGPRFDDVIRIVRRHLRAAELIGS